MSKHERYNRPNFEKKEEPVVEKKEEVVETKEAPIPKPKKAKVKTDLNLRTAPEVADNIMCVLKQGTEVEIMDLETEPGWLNIVCEPINGVEMRGFVMSEFISQE